MIEKIFIPNGESFIEKKIKTRSYDITILFKQTIDTNRDIYEMKAVSININNRRYLVEFMSPKMMGTLLTSKTNGDVESVINEYNAILN